MLLILPEDLQGALAVLSADPEDDERPLWALDNRALPKRVRPSGRRVLLDSFAIEATAPFDLGEMVQSGRRFDKIDAAQQRLNELMRDKVAERLARLIDAAGSGGDFRVLVHSRDWSHFQDGIRMALHLSAALCGEFLEQGQGPVGPERGNWPSPKRIFSKIRSAEAAARISKEMAVRDVMDA